MEPRIEVTGVEELLETVSMEAVKQWLKANGLKHSSPNKDEFKILLTGYEKDGTLTPEQIDAALLDFEEHGAKEYFFFHIEPPPFKDKTRDDFLEHLKTIKLWSGEDMILARSLYSEKRIRAGKDPEYRMVDYITWEDHDDGPRIRAKFSETHERQSYDFNKEKVNVEKFTKIIVLIHEVLTGFTQVRFDRPTGAHSHYDEKDNMSKEAYQAYYRKMAALLLGIKVDDWFDPRRCMKTLARTDPPRSSIMPSSEPGEYVPSNGGSPDAPEPVLTDLASGDGAPPDPALAGQEAEVAAPPDPAVFRLRYEEVRTGSNSIQSYTSRLPKADIRGDEAHKAAFKKDEGHWRYRVIKGYWLPGTCGPYTLTRELFMGMNTNEKKIWFSADCMPDEVNYALCKIKTLC